MTQLQEVDGHHRHHVTGRNAAGVRSESGSPSTAETEPRDEPPTPGRARPHLLDMDEAAAYLNVPRRWLAEAVRQRRIRCSRMGKNLRFLPEHLAEFVAACEQPVSSPVRAETSPRQDRRRSRL